MNLQVLAKPLMEVEADALVVGVPADAKTLPPRVAALGTYTFDRYKREKHDKAVAALTVVAPDARAAREAAEGLRRGEIFARATWFARDLVNAPANEVHPTHLARVAAEVAKEGKLK